MKRIVMVVLMVAPSAHALTWTTNKVERGTSMISSAAENEYVRRLLRPLRHAEQKWEIVWPSGPETNLVRALRLSLSASADVSFGESGSKFPATTGDDIRSLMIARTDEFDADFREFVKDEPTTGRRYYSDITAGPSFSSKRVICLRTEGCMYTGGAHGMSFIGHSVHDALSGREIPLGEIIPPARQKILCGMLESRFRRDHGLTATNHLNEILFEDRMSITSNYTCTADGLMFTFSLYEIAPYSEGFIEITLPWADVRGLLTTGTAVRAEADVRARTK